MIYINESGKHIKINSNTEINIEARKPSGKTIDTYNSKDSPLSSLYSQVEHLRNELEDKHLLVRTLII